MISNEMPDERIQSGAVSLSSLCQIRALPKVQKLQFQEDGKGLKIEIAGNEMITIATR